MTTNLITRKEQKLQLDGNLVTGDTFPLKSFLKTYCNGTWDKNSRGWVIDTEKLDDLISTGNSIGLRVDDSPQTTSRKATGTASTSGWCNLCHSYCWGDCQA